MPLPAPKGESEKDFVSKHMGDKVLMKEWPDQKQRLAILFSIFKRHTKSASGDTANPNTDTDFFIDALNDPLLIEQYPNPVDRKAVVMRMSRLHKDSMEGDGELDNSDFKPKKTKDNTEEVFVPKDNSKQDEPNYSDRENYNSNEYEDEVENVEELYSAVASAGLMVNGAAVNHALNLIKAGKVNRNKYWRGPSLEKGNNHIKQNGYASYGKFFLARSIGGDQEHKSIYKFPITNDFETIHVGGLKAAKHRAGQYGFGGCEKAAHQLLMAAGEGIKDQSAQANFVQKIYKMENGKIRVEIEDINSIDWNNL